MSRGGGIRRYLKSYSMFLFNDIFDIVTTLERVVKISHIPRYGPVFEIQKLLSHSRNSQTFKAKI